MTLGMDVVKLAKTRIGEKYKNVAVPLKNPNYHGPWDCAEFATWCAFHASGGKVILGYRSQHGEAHTTWWAEDAKKLGLVVSPKDASVNPGYFVMRLPVGSKMGHIAICEGDGEHSIEANSTATGVGRFSLWKTPSGSVRKWDFGIKLPTIQEIANLYAEQANPANWWLAASAKPTHDIRVAAVQDALNATNIATKVDGLFTAGLATLIGKFQKREGLVVDGAVGGETAGALKLPWAHGRAAKKLSGVYNPKYGVVFDSLVPGGYFSPDPDDLSVDRSVRTNNAGAINISNWQKKRRGFVGETFADKHGNRTAIYRTPEHGVAAWYHLITRKYGFTDFTLEEMARRYAGTSKPGPVNAYVNGWIAGSGGALDASSRIDVVDNGQMLTFAKAMFAHERRGGAATPLSDVQILFGINAEKNNNLPD